MRLKSGARLQYQAELVINNCQRDVFKNNKFCVVMQEHIVIPMVPYPNELRTLTPRFINNLIFLTGGRICSKTTVLLPNCILTYGLGSRTTPRGRVSYGKSLRIKLFGIKLRQSTLKASLVTVE